MANKKYATKKTNIETKGLFTPKLFTVLREGYHLHNFRADILAGLTVAIVALPLSIAIAIASGATPAQGLYTSIIGGFIISLLGGSRFQIGGPAGAFIIVVATTVQTHGMDGLLLATIMSGIMLMIIGYLKFGTYIKFIPYPVTVGFTSGIAVIIFSSQLINMLGLQLDRPEPGPLLQKIPLIWTFLPTFNPTSVIFCIVTISIIIGLKKHAPKLPGMLIAVIIGGITTAIGHFDIVTIGSRFGEMPSHLPMPHIPAFSIEKAIAVLPNAITFTLLGAIESLLSAVVADSMTGRRHRSNCELVAQGVGNIASALFSGICVTGTIARTATNIRAGAHGPVSGIMHAVFLLLFMLIAAPLTSYIPLATLAGILALVSWNMIEKHALAVLLRASWGDAIVLLTTFFLTIFRDLTEAIIIGFALGALLFIYRMSKIAEVITDSAFVGDDYPDDNNPMQRIYDEDAQRKSQVVVYRISGVFFFGAAASIASVLDRITDNHNAIIIDFSNVPFLDATGANTIETLATKAKAKNIPLVLTGTSHQIRKDLISHAIKPPLVHFETSIARARDKYDVKPTLAD